MRTLVKIILIVLIIAVIAFLGWLGYNELSAYTTDVDERFAQQDKEVIALEELVELQKGQLQEQQQQIEFQQSTLEDQEQELDSVRLSAVKKAQLVDVQDALDKDITDLDEMRLSLTMQINGLVTETQSLTQTISVLDSGQITLQEDMGTISSTLDVLRTEFDGLQAEVVILQDQSTTQGEELSTIENEISEADIDGLRQSIFLFRLWEMITRARIRLAEQNPGLASGDVELAQTAVADFIENGPETLVSPLIKIERRLLLAAENLPDEPELAISDLDLAWRELDAIISDILGVPSEP